MITQMVGKLMRRNHWVAKIKPPWCYSDINTTVLKIDNTVDNTPNTLKHKTFLCIKPWNITWFRMVYQKSKMPVVTRNNPEDIFNVSWAIQNLDETQLIYSFLQSSNHPLHTSTANFDYQCTQSNFKAVGLCKLIVFSGGDSRFLWSSRAGH